jgi:hypothetical protein
MEILVYTKIFYTDMFSLLKVPMDVPVSTNLLADKSLQSEIWRWWGAIMKIRSISTRFKDLMSVRTDMKFNASCEVMISLASRLR